MRPIRAGDVGEAVRAANPRMNITTNFTSHSPRILAVAYGGGHIAMMLPVLRALRTRRPHITITLLALTTAAGVARDAGETPLGYADLLNLLSPEEQTRALALGRALQPGNSHPDISEAETVAYLGINAWDLQQQHGPQAAQTLLETRGRHGFHPLHFFRRVLRALQPDLVLATNSPRSEFAVVDAATEAGIPSLALLDLFALPGDAFAARTRYPSRVCVLSEAVRDNLIRAGWPPERIAATGNPAFDLLHDPDTLAAAHALRERLGWSNRQVVLLAAHPEPRSHPATPWPAGDALPLAMEAALRDWVHARPNAALIVRHHPNHWHRYPRLPDDTQVHFSVPGKETVDPLIVAANCVVVQTTTVGLQAATVGIPVLAMQCSPGALGAFNLAALGIAQGVADVPDLPAALDATLARPPTQTNWARTVSAAYSVAEEVFLLLPDSVGCCP